MPSYEYEPLPKGSIRLLRLLPRSEEHPEIRCQLFNCALLKSGSTHPYEALSYAWGPKDNQRSIYIDNCEFSITTQLHIALLHLQDRFVERILWIDCICINQRDEYEKGQQLGSIAEIYAGASRVIVWFGEMADKRHQRLEIIRVAAEKQSINSTDSASDKTSQQAISLLQKPWYQRLWELHQEFAAARYVPIKSSSPEIDGYTFYSGLSAFDSGLSAFYSDLSALELSDETYQEFQHILPLIGIESAHHSEHSEGTAEDLRFFIFDSEENSRTTQPSTVPTSHQRAKSPMVHRILGIENVGEPSMIRQETTDLGDEHALVDDETEQHSDADESDMNTIYSVDTISEDTMPHYLQVFAAQLIGDIKHVSGDLRIEDIPADDLDAMLREFAWKLYGESSNPFGWEASVAINRTRKNIMQLLSPGTRGAQTETSSTRGEGDKESSRESYKKPMNEILAWIDDVDPSSPAIDFPQLPQYKELIRQSAAYRWLLSKVHQHSRLTSQEPKAMLGIGTRIRNQLQAQESLRKMSGRKPPVPIKMTFQIDWNPITFMLLAGITTSFAEALPRILCLTGTWNEAQALTVGDYMDQTWPETGQALIALLSKLVSLPVGETCSQIPAAGVGQDQPGGSGPGGARVAELTARIESPYSCSIHATGGLYFVSEIGEQIAWLAAALRPSPLSKGVVACTPRVKDLQAQTLREEAKVVIVVGSCNLVFDFKTAKTCDLTPGFCWGRLFCSAVLVWGYPILQRSQPRTGLEISLDHMAAITGSCQIVQWDQRVIMKGFNMLMVATLAAADMVVWHLLLSDKSDERISYVDSRLDEIVTDNSEGISLRMLEGNRHVIGWCSQATDWCGKAEAYQDIQPSGLEQSPSSIVIDRLYLEGGGPVVGGLNMKINMKEQPVWLQRENDYPSLLKWVLVQPIVFYDVGDRRAWLVDGASALLHLVRTSLYREENDPYSPYDWVFDAAKLKDKWDGLSGCRAAMKTLASLENRSMKVYAKGNGVSGIEYSTLDDFVKKIMHSMEILIDWQAKVSSQDGIRISQTWDLRREIFGFDILDIIAPEGPVHRRFKRQNSVGHGWMDLTPAIGATTIFGRELRDLIRPDQPETVCKTWNSVPKGEDYMAASVSTLQMLYERRLQRMMPNLNVGQMTSKIIWTSPNHPFKTCQCLQTQGNTGNIRSARSSSSTDTSSGRHAESANCHDPVQYLAQTSWPHWEHIVLRNAKPVDLKILNQDFHKGAVIFGHIPLKGLRNHGKPASEKHDPDGDASTMNVEEMLQTPVTSSSTGNRSPGSVGSTNITVPSGGVSRSGEGNDEGGSVDNEDKEDEKTRRWPGFRKWKPRMGRRQ